MAKEIALEIVQGKPAKSCNLPSKYSYILTKTNNNTITHLKRDENDNFLYYFVVFGSYQEFYTVNQADDCCR